jgi:hypothetical protein
VVSGSAAGWLQREASPSKHLHPRFLSPSFLAPLSINTNQVNNQTTTTMPISEGAQCAMTIMWFSAFGMIISFLRGSPLVFLFLFAFVFNCMALMKGMATTGKKHDELDEVELQPLEMVQGTQTTVNFKANREMTLGDLLNKY